MNKIMKHLQDKVFYVFVQSPHKILLKILQDLSNENNLVQIEKVPVYSAASSRRLPFFKKLEERDGFTHIFNKLIMKKEPQLSKINLTDINSIDASKSKHHEYKTLYDFGEYTFKGTNWNLETCLKWSEIPSVLDIKRYKWNNNNHWDNNGGSHHMAVAIYHLINSSLTYTIDANITEYLIDKSIANDLLNNYLMFVIKIDYNLKSKIENLITSSNANKKIKTYIVGLHQSNVTMICAIKMENACALDSDIYIDYGDYIMNLNSLLKDLIESSQ